MRIEFKHMKRALELGCYLSVGGGRYRIFWPEQNVELFGATADGVIHAIERVQREGARNRPRRQDDEAHINGIPTNGAVAYREGIPASDCPYMEEDDDFARWNDEWDEAADREVEKERQERTKPPVGSIITNRYRAKYSEYGHPTHCGDALATLLNNLCNNKAGTNLGLFEAICAANGISLAKYSRTTKGWQGRLRMTGRNLLAKRVAENHGKLMLPEGLGQDYIQLGTDWVQETVNKFKPRVES